MSHLNKTNYILLFSLSVLFACRPATEQKKQDISLTDLLESAQWIDLTYSYDKNTVYWPTNVSFTHDTVFYGYTDKGYFYSSFKFAAEEHGGTHFDAPIHFFEKGLTVEQIPIEELRGPGVIVDVSERGLKDPDYLITAEDFIEWEAEHGTMPNGAIVLVYTGHGKFYNNRTKFLGTDLTGPEAVPELHFPGLSAEGAEWLAKERNISAVGLDTPSIDYGQSTDFMAHRILCENGITVYENVANLEQVPPSGSFIIALPMKIKGGSGAPLRIVAVVPKHRN